MEKTKKGKELNEYLAKASPEERAEYLINVIDPYLSISPFDEAFNSRTKALEKYFLKASELFDCTIDEIESCYNKYGYPLPIELYLKLYYGQTENIIYKLIEKSKAKLLWDNVVKPEIDKKIKDCECLDFPVSECKKYLREKYQSYGIMPKLENLENSDKFMFYCWQDYIEPYLDDNSKSQSTGFQSSLTDEQIQRLFELLKGKYIDKNTNPDHFKAIFKNEPLPAGFISIIRVKKFTNTLLAYFVSELFYKENQSDYWHIAASCFDKAKNLKQSLNNTIQYNPDNKPKGYKEIDIILKNIYPPLQ